MLKYCALFLIATFLVGCNGSSEPAGVQGDPGKARSDMIKNHANDANSPWAKKDGGQAPQTGQPGK